MPIAKPNLNRSPFNFSVSSVLIDTDGLEPYIPPRKTSITVEDKVYREGFTFALKIPKHIGITIMPTDWNTNTDKTTISGNNFQKYAFVFKYYEDGNIAHPKAYPEYDDTCVVDVYEDCKFKFESRFTFGILSELFSGQSGEVQCLELGYDKIPDCIYQPCTCDTRSLMAFGCKCGGFDREQEFYTKTEEFNKLLRNLI